MNWFLQFELYQCPLVKLNSVSLYRIERANLLVVSTKSKDNLVKSYNTASIPSHSHGSSCSPDILSNGVSLTSIQVLLAVMASESINTGIRETEKRREECSFEYHWWLLYKLLVPTKENVSL